MWAMAFKNRTEPTKLKILRILNSRMELSFEDRNYFSSLDKGYEGEVQFDLLTEKLESGLLILNDLLLQVNKTKFQIDSLIISPITIYACEVKNFEGDYFYKDNLLYIKKGPEIKDPLLQLERSKSLLRQYLQKLGFSIPIESYLIFINPAFTLYQAPLNDSFVFPTQINRFLKKLDRETGNLRGRHWKLAEHLVSAHIIDSPYDQLPDYSFNKMRKGLTCPKCHSYSIYVGDKKISCDDCGYEEKIEIAVVRGVEELKLLFPDLKITTNLVNEWCEIDINQKRIRRILISNYKAIGMNNSRYYQ